MQPGPADNDGSRAAPETAPPTSPSRRRWRRLIALTALAAGLCGLAVAAAGVASQVLPRRFTPAQRLHIEHWEVAKRWRALPESAIFPASVPYRVAGNNFYSNKGLSLTARRLGVSSATRCDDAASPVAAAILRRSRCSTLLRATYADSTGSMVATVGVAVLTDDAAADAAEMRLHSRPRGDQSGGVRPAAVAGTLASRFSTDTRRQLNIDSRTGPYLILATVGYADGRPHVRITADQYLQGEMTGLAQGLDEAVTGALGKPPATPSCPGAPGC